ncbi:leucine-rich repeat-containing protein 15-like [Chironomus tepperi]|uniref:leucine-rich repeat-containing protein 15-like n=1 Tax=Chironomus tepperi TaxID=113505 RepID=UPI00391F022D
MTSINPQNPHQTLIKSSIFLTITTILFLITLCPHQSTQQSIITKSSTIQATCVYNYTYYGLYTCDLSYNEPVNRTDVLEITGIHLPNHTDDDVEAVYQYIRNETYFNGDAMRKFVNLKRISIIGRDLIDITPNSFDVCAKLEALAINYGKYKTLPSGLLKNCVNLRTFEIMSSEIETFPEDFFGSTRNLEEFVVPVNQLTSLPEKLLQNMEKLRIIRIGYNNLKELSPNFLINCPNLDQFSAYDNQFQTQEAITFALNGRINMRYLMLDFNNITNWDFRFFAQFQKLEYLTVGINRGAKLTNIHWRSLPASLNELTVYGIGEDIPENSFERLVNLRALTLYGNDITAFHKDTFKSLTNLWYLYIYQSELKTLHPDLFQDQGNLSHLMISGTKIEELPAGLFVPLVNIGFRNQNNGIHVKHSKLIRINANSFGEHPKLRTIDFAFNEINEIERGIFSKFHPNMTYVGLYFNDCVSALLDGVDLDNHERLEQCYQNWVDIDPNNRPTTVPPTSTTPAGCGSNFKSFEVFVIIFVGIFKVLFDYVK